MSVNNGYMSRKKDSRPYVSATSKQNKKNSVVRKKVIINFEFLCKKKVKKKKSFFLYSS